MKYICSIQVISMSIFFFNDKFYQCQYYLENQKFWQELMTVKDHSAKVHIGLILKFLFFNFFFLFVSFSFKLGLVDQIFEL